MYGELPTVTRKIHSAQFVRTNKLFAHISVPVYEYCRQIFVRIIRYTDSGNAFEELGGGKLARQIVDVLLHQLAHRHSIHARTHGRITLGTIEQQNETQRKTAPSYDTTDMFLFYSVHWHHSSTIVPALLCALETVTASGQLYDKPHLRRPVLITLKYLYLYLTCTFLQRMKDQR